jgi:hypothetical protein
MKIAETTEEVSSHPGENGRREPKQSTKHPLFQRITGADWKKVLANQWNRKRITKKAHADRGPETIWEMSDYVDIRVNRSHSPKTPTLPPAHFIVTRSVFVVQAIHIQPYLEWVGKYFPCEP